MSGDRREDLTITWHELGNVANTRNLFLYGDGTAGARCIAELGDRITGVIDRNSAGEGKPGNLGVPSWTPEDLLQHGDPRPAVVITTTSVSPVIEFLSAGGFIPGQDFWVAPHLLDRLSIDELRRVRVDAFFTSGTVQGSESTRTGGIYRIYENDLGCNVMQVFEGEAHGLVRYGSGFLATTATRGVVEFDVDWNPVRTQRGGPQSRQHGIAFNSVTREVVTVGTLTDELHFYDVQLQYKYSLPICECHSFHSPGQHHANDLCLSDMGIVVSMFSLSGSYKSQVYDGGALLLRQSEGAWERSRLAQGLTMPHSVSIIDGSLAALDSYYGSVLLRNFQPNVQLSGFARGLATMGDRLLVGQSLNRNFSLLEGRSGGSSIDTCVTLVDHRHKIFRSLPLDPALGEIHALCR